MISCHDTEERLQDLLDERRCVEQDPQLQLHLQSCEHCRQIVDDYFIVSRLFPDQKLAPTAASPLGGRLWRGMKIFAALAAIYVLMVQPLAWSLHQMQTDELALQEIAFSQPLGGDKIFNRTGSMDSDQDQQLYAQDDTISVATVLDVSRLFRADLSQMDASQSSLVRPLVRPVNRSWNQLLESIPSTEQQVMQMEAMQMEMSPVKFQRPELESFLKVWTNPFS
jgi:hypothetical protein